MLASLRNWSDRLLGRGSATIAVPVMDGVLTPNRALDEAEVAAELPDIDDLAATREALYIAAGQALLRLDAGGQGASAQTIKRFDQPITALAASGDGAQIALALAGAQIVLLAPDGTVFHTLREVAGRALCSVNAIAHDPAGQRWLFTEGSASHPPERWCHDLMGHGASGRVCAWTPAAAAPQEAAQQLAHGLRHAFGVLPQASGASALVSESWAHRVVQQATAQQSAPLLEHLPAYPSRMAAASGGGFWLSCFACRTQLVEFVLREDQYRRRMVAEIDPRYWIAPALSSGNSFLEPLQGAGVKQMGVLKPWAPPRSYGLVLRVDAQGQPVASLHSQVDGRHHGITAVAEYGGALYLASKGSGRLLRITQFAA